jgi:hypothetical protein
MGKLLPLFGNKKGIATIFVVIVTILGIIRLSDQLSLALNSQLDKERSTALRYALILSISKGEI